MVNIPRQRADGVRLLVSVRRNRLVSASIEHCRNISHHSAILEDLLFTLGVMNLA